MLIWILAVGLFVLFAALGYAKGAIRTMFSLFGLFLGVALAVPLAPIVRPIVPLVGLKNPVWSWLLPPVIVFFLIAIIFVIVGFLVHRKLYLFYKYKTDDYQRLSWEHLNKRLGACMGLVAGASYTILVGLVVYIIGYLTVQVSAGDNDAAVVRYLNKARADLRESGLEKIVALFDPTPANYYQASDLIGLLYHNPLLYTRLAGYPPFLALAERQEFQDVATDTEFQNLLQTQPAVGQVVNHPKTQAILNNQEIIQQIEQTDLKDLHGYLKTGESPKYVDTRILGRWQLDPYATLLQLKKRKTGISTAEMRLLKQQLEFVKSYTLVATPDNTVRLKGPDVMPLMEKYLGELARAFAEGPRKTAPRPAVAVPAPASQPAAPSTADSSAAMRQRYGLNRPGARAAAPAPVPATTYAAAPAPASAPLPSPAAIAAEIAALPIVVLAQGTWKGEGSQFAMSMQAQAAGFKFDNGKSATLEAEIRDGRLYMTEGDSTTVMDKF